MKLPLLCLIVCAPSIAGIIDDRIHLAIEPPHAWRPPFGLDRVHALSTAVVEIAGTPLLTAQLAIEQLNRDKSLSTTPLAFSTTTPSIARVKLDARCTEVVLLESSPSGKNHEIARESVALPPLAIEATAEPDSVINPVVLGTILVPNGTLLLGPNQHARLRVAALNRTATPINATLTARFASQKQSLTKSVALEPAQRVDLTFDLPTTTPHIERDTLIVELANAPNLPPWKREFPVMIVADPPALPRFGATALKLRFDQPISLRDPNTGAYSFMDYNQAWNSTLNDVVVSLPNGSRLVFWRGASYIPFWAGPHNTCLCTEWAEEITRRPGAVDCVEPLMDKELRYGRVEILESTPARVHVRWSYQSTDLLYHTWGDSAVEDYYFYPDGFGTRVLTLAADPAAEYELSEFILITPQAAYPLDVIPEAPIDVLPLSGPKHTIKLPIAAEQENLLRTTTPWPAAYRVRFNRHDPETLVYFNPNDLAFPPVVFGPFFDRGEMVTPAYWGSHWPLARGNATGSKIDSRIDITPSHNSLLSWAKQQPTPTHARDQFMRDTLGVEKTMRIKRWAWLVGVTDQSDEQVIKSAKAYAFPPDAVVAGGRVSDPLSFIERRALAIEIHQPTVQITLTPKHPADSLALEINGTNQDPESITIDGQPLDPEHYDCHRHIIWIRHPFHKTTRIELQFPAQ